MRRRIADGKRAADRAQLLEELHEHADAGGAQERDLRQVESNMVAALPDDLSQGGGQVVGPISIQPPDNADLHVVALRDFRYLHGLLIEPPPSARRRKTSRPASGPPCR